ncbi:MAG: group III truncated hemoglobin [Bacteroidota bacterium]
MKDIQTIQDIRLLVDTFYGKVRQDDLIGPIFNEVIQDKWAMHLEKMYAFWQTVLLQEITYGGRPFPPHMKLAVEQEHFDRWLGLFVETLDALFEGEKVMEAKWRAEKMAQMFHAKISYYRGRQSYPLA